MPIGMHNPGVPRCYSLQGVGAVCSFAAPHRCSMLPARLSTVSLRLACLSQVTNRHLGPSLGTIGPAGTSAALCTSAEHREIAPDTTQRSRMGQPLSLLVTNRIPLREPGLMRSRQTGRLTLSPTPRAITSTNSPRNSVIISSVRRHLPYSIYKAITSIHPSRRGFEN